MLGNKKQELNEPKNYKIIVCMMVFYYVVNMFNLRSTAPLVEMPFKYTIREFTIPKKLIFPKGEGSIFISTLWMSLIMKFHMTELILHSLLLKKKSTVLKSLCYYSYHHCRLVG